MEKALVGLRGSFCDGVGGLGWSGDVGVEELHPDDKEPQPKSEAKRPPWDVVTRKGTEEDAAEASEDEVAEEVSMGGMLRPMGAAPGEREDEAEEDICADDLCGREGAEREQGRGAEGTCACGGEAHFGTDGKHEERKKIAAAGLLCLRA